MMAAALGAEVRRGPAKEVGFAPLEILDPSLQPLAGVPVLHWHGDTFDLPPGTQLLASSARYAHQAFRRGSQVLALQFHAEMGLDERFEQWVKAWPADVAASGRSADDLRADYRALGPAAVAAGRGMIAHWLGGLR
jgi:GMP synthase (glutamine-hydrolysing)